MQQERRTTRSGSVDSALDQSGGVGGKRRGDRALGAIVCVGEDTDDGAEGEDGYVGQGAEREIPHENYMDSHCEQMLYIASVGWHLHVYSKYM